MDDYTQSDTAGDYGSLLDAADGIVGPRKKRPTQDPRVKSILDRMRGGESKQESTDDTGAVNPDSGAVGEFQVLPTNVPKWTLKHYGKSLTPDEFRKNPQAQQAVFNGEMGSYVRKALGQSGGDDERAMRMAAAAWYGGLGAMHRYDDPTPQYYKGKPYPSFREYTSKVVSKSKTGQTFDYADLLKQAGAIVGNAQQNQPQTDYQDLLKQAADIAGPGKVSPGLPNPNPVPEPQQTLQTPAGVIPNPAAPTITPPQQTPVPETTNTLGAQATSMLDANSPRSAVLVTPGEKLPLLGNSSGLATVNLPEGTLIVNPKKLGIKAKDVPAYVKQNGFAKLIGKVDDVSDTTQGPALVTKDANGTELSSSIVNSPQSAHLQAQVDQAQFPQTATQEIKPAQAVVNDRINSQQQPTAPISTGNSTNVGAQTQPPANVGQQTKPKYTESDFTAWTKLMGVPKTPKTREKFEEDLAAAGPGSVETSINPSDFKVGGVQYTSPNEVKPGETSVTSSDLEQGQSVAGGTVTVPREIGKPNDSMMGVARRFAPTDAANTQDAARKSILAAASSLDLPVDNAKLDAYIKRTGGLNNDYQKGDQIGVLWSTLAEVAGDKPVHDAMRLEQGQNLTTPPDMSAQTKAAFTGDDVRDTLGNVGSAVGQTLGNSGLGQELGEDTAGFLEHLNSSLGGGTAKLLLGLGRFVNDLSPTKGESMAEARHAVKHVDSFDQALLDTASGADQIVRTNSKDGVPSWVFNTAGDVIGAAPRFAMLSVLPGGSIAAMAIDMGGQSYGSGADPKTALKEFGKGAAYGTLFKFAPKIAGSKGIVGEGVTLGTIGAGTYATARVFGESHEEALHDAVMNAGLHAVTTLQEKGLEKLTKQPDHLVVRAENGDGDVLAAEIKPDGTVVSVNPKTPANVEVHVPMKAGTQGIRMDTFEPPREKPSVPATEPEAEKTQYSSQLDEIRQKNAKTTKQVQQLFPDAQLTREEAADLRRQAWGEQPTNKASEQVTGNTAGSIERPADKSTAETNTNAAAPDTTPEKDFEISSKTGPTTTGVEGITKRLINERNQARRDAETDKPTGLGNKDAFDRAKATAEADPKSSIITLDLNGLKAANDQHPEGHSAGDKFIKEAADILQNENSRNFRTGGDELTAIADKEKAADIIKNVEDKFGVKTFTGKDGKTYQVSITGTHGDTFAEADSQLTEAKKAAKIARADEAGITAYDREGNPLNGSQNATANAGGRSTEPDTASGQGQPGKGKGSSGQSTPEANPDFFHDGRPAVKLQQQGKRLKIQYLDGKKETPWVLAKDVKSATDKAPKTATVKSETIKPSQKVYTERGTEADIETRTIPRDQILTSLDEGYPAELQPRDRSRTASKDQINEIAGKLNPELLGDSPKASDGRPLVVPVEVNGETKYAVVSGNGRTEAIRKASGDAAEAYDKFVQSKGGKPSDIYAGVLDPKTDLEKFAREANESSTAKMSASEQAQTDAKDLDLSNFTPAEDGSIHTGANRDFIKKFVGKLPASERGEMMLPDGTLSQSGVNRIRNAVFAKAYGESETGLAVIQRMAESTDNNVKRITSALLQNAPAFADLKENIEGGTRYPGLDITDDITKAVEKFSFLRENGDSVEEFLKQRGLFGEDMSPFQKRIVAVLDTHKNSAKALSSILNNYIRLANAVGDPKQIGMFGGTADENAGTLFSEAVLQYERGNELQPTNQVSLLDPDQGGEVQSESGGTRPQDVSATDETAANQAEDRQGSEVSSSGSGTEQAQLKSGDTVRKDGAIGKVDDRNGKLRVKFEKDGRSLSQPLDDTWSKAANPEAGSASTDLLTLGLGKTLKEDVGPGVKEAARTFKESADDIRKAVFVTGRGTAAKLSGGELRKNLAEMARSYDIAQHALKVARNYFAKNPIEDNYDFIGHIESGNIGDLPEHEQPFAKELRRLLDEARDRVRSLGTGKLDEFIKNYFPHIWKDPKKAADIFSTIMARRPFEGSKAFLKKRSIDTFKEGLEAGLEPISDNPVDLALLKIREMDRYVAAHRTLQYLKENNLAKFVRIGEEVPKGFVKIDDKISTVFGSPMVDFKEGFDAHLMKGLEDFADSLNIPHKRKIDIGGKDRWGYAKDGEVVTKFAGPESVLAHEIGHVLDHRYGLAKLLLKDPKIRAELNKLADQRFAGIKDVPGSFKRYVRKGGEKMAVIFESLIHAPHLLEEHAPNTLAELHKIADEHPELKPLFKIKPSVVMDSADASKYAGGLVITGNYYAAEPAAKVINNHLSPGLQGSSAFRAWRYAGNLMNQFQLGFSAFHAAFTTLDAITSKAALAIEQFGSGRPIAAAKSAAETPVSWLTNLIRGDKVYREWLTPGSTDPLTQQMTKLMVEAGGRAKMDDFYHTRAATKMLDAFKRGNILGGVLRVPTGTVDLVSRPVMEWLVPRQKLGVFADLAKSEVNRLGEDATPQQIREAMQKAWDSVDNRMGQLVYDNLFWNRLVKDVSMASVRSVGWNLGSVREMGGGIKDTVTLPLRVRRALKEGKAVDPIVTHRMAYVAALPVVTAIVGAMTQYLFTGKGPTELKDYFFPRTGNVDENGRPERLSLPTYMRDVYAYTRHPEKTATHKLHPLISTVAEMLENKDYYGTEIRNADDPIVQQILDEAKYLGKNVTPFAVQGLQKERERKGGIATKILPFFGFTPAPKDVNSTKAEDLLSEIQAQHREVGSRTKAEAERSQLLSDLVREKKLGQDYRTDMHKAIAAGLLKHSDINLIKKRATTDYLSYGVKKLPLDDALKVYEAADDQEKAKLRVIMKIKAMNAAAKGGLNKELKQTLKSFGLLRQREPATDAITNQ